MGIEGRRTSGAARPAAERDNGPRRGTNAGDRGVAGPCERRAAGNGRRERDCRCAGIPAGDRQAGRRGVACRLRVLWPGPDAVGFCGGLAGPGPRGGLQVPVVAGDGVVRPPARPPARRDPLADAQPRHLVRREDAVAPEPRQELLRIAGGADTLDKTLDLARAGSASTCHWRTCSSATPTPARRATSSPARTSARHWCWASAAITWRSRRSTSIGSSGSRTARCRSSARSSSLTRRSRARRSTPPSSPTGR